MDCATRFRAVGADCAPDHVSGGTERGEIASIHPFAVHPRESSAATGMHPEAES